MVKRNSPNDVKSLSDLSRLGEIVVDKRNGKRADAKKNRRNRHYENQFIRNSLSKGLAADDADDTASVGPESDSTSPPTRPT
jgi:hypothetical protein